MTSSEQKKQVAEEVMLDYFNRTLYEKGFINESVRNRMKRLIQARNGSRSTKAAPLRKSSLER